MTLEQRGVRPRVAVVIPCFNAARHIGEAITSVLRQTYDEIDIVVVNDGSTDDFEGAVAPFRDRITVLTQANSGQGTARNRGIAAAHAEFIAFLDADDRWHEDKTARQVALLRDRPECGVVHTGRQLIDAEGAAVGASPLAPEPAHHARGDCLLDLIGGNPIIASSVMVRRSLLAGEEFATDLSGVEDWDMWLRLAARTRFARIDEPLTHYRVHSTNFSWDRRVMARATAHLMERVLSRHSDTTVRAAAAAHRHEAILEVAHREYERGNRLEAQRWFRKAAPWLHWADLVRYGGTFVPPRMHVTAQRAWRAMRGRRRS
jgi:glycosyltransferase involved in cell wall biosynthesis